MVSLFDVTQAEVKEELENLHNLQVASSTTATARPIVTYPPSDDESETSDASSANLHIARADSLDGSAMDSLSLVVANLLKNEEVQHTCSALPLVYPTLHER
jgi:hypothetical protein